MTLAVTSVSVLAISPDPSRPGWAREQCRGSGRGQQSSAARRAMGRRRRVACAHAEVARCQCLGARLECGWVAGLPWLGGGAADAAARVHEAERVPRVRGPRAGERPPTCRLPRRTDPGLRGHRDRQQRPQGPDQDPANALLDKKSPGDEDAVEFRQLLGQAAAFAVPGQTPVVRPTAARVGLRARPPARREDR